MMTLAAIRLNQLIVSFERRWVRDGARAVTNFRAVHVPYVAGALTTSPAWSRVFARLPAWPRTASAR
jgi:hypothetical protein